MLMGVYGTLRKGFANYNYFLKGKKLIGTTKIKGYKMYNLGLYPCIVYAGGDCEVVMEIYELDDEKDKDIIKSIDGMEIGAGYRISYIETEFGTVQLYTFFKKPEHATLIEDGDWSKYYK